MIIDQLVQHKDNLEEAFYKTTNLLNLFITEYSNVRSSIDEGILTRQIKQSTVVFKNLYHYVRVLQKRIYKFQRYIKGITLAGLTTIEREIMDECLTIIHKYKWLDQELTNLQNMLLENLEHD